MTPALAAKRIELIDAHRKPAAQGASTVATGWGCWRDTCWPCHGNDDRLRTTPDRNGAHYATVIR